MNSDLSPSTPSNDVLIRSRTHIKALFVPVFVEVLMTAALIAAVVALPNTVAGVSVSLVLVIAWLIFSVIIMVPTLIAWRFSTFEITSRSVRTSTGFIWRRTRDVPISRITDISVEQGLLDRIVGCGTVVFADASSPQGARMRDIPHVNHVKDVLDGLIYDNRR